MLKLEYRANETAVNLHDLFMCIVNNEAQHTEVRIHRLSINYTLPENKFEISDNQPVVGLINFRNQNVDPNHFF